MANAVDHSHFINKHPCPLKNVVLARQKLELAKKGGGSQQRTFSHNTKPA